MSEDEMSVDDMSADKMTELVNWGQDGCIWNDCRQDAFICHVCKLNYSRLDACREGVCGWNDCQ